MGRQGGSHLIVGPRGLQVRAQDDGKDIMGPRRVARSGHAPARRFVVPGDTGPIVHFTGLPARTRVLLSRLSRESTCGRRSERGCLRIMGVLREGGRGGLHRLESAFLLREARAKVRLGLPCRGRSRGAWQRCRRIALYLELLLGVLEIAQERGHGVGASLGLHLRRELDPLVVAHLVFIIPDTTTLSAGTVCRLRPRASLSPS